MANETTAEGLRPLEKADPLAISDAVVFVDALERKSGQSCRVRIPLNIVRMAAEQASQTYAA